MPLQVQKRSSTVMPEDYIPEDYRDEQNPPKFKLRPLTGPQKLEVIGEYNERNNRITAARCTSASPCSATSRARSRSPRSCITR